MQHTASQVFCILEVMLQHRHSLAEQHTYSEPQLCRASLFTSGRVACIDSKAVEIR